MITFKLSQIRDGRERFAFYTDLAMVLLVIINILWIAFDWHFGFEFFRNIIKELSPDFFNYYNSQIHPNFLLYDGVFVTIYVTEILIRWGLAIKRRTYYKWFFYPFVHWYDVLGCIPLGTFRVLRIFRVLAMVYRLQRMNVIDLTQTYVYKVVKQYYDMLVEEVSDRVVVNVINGVQKEIEFGTPVTDRMISEIIKPHQDTITTWLSHRVKKVAEHNYTLYKEDIRKYTKETIADAVQNNQEMKNIEAIPILGKQITTSIEQSVSGITFNVINNLVGDLASDRNNKVIDEITDILFEALLLEEEDEDLNKITKDIFLRALDLVKEHVQMKKWKVREGDTNVSGEAQVAVAG